jgi:hypothetical protein
MSCPLTSVVNPQNPDQVMVFYLSGNQSPGLELHDVGASTTTVTAFTDNLSGPVDSKIVNPGSFSALNCNGLVSHALNPLLCPLQRPKASLEGRTLCLSTDIEFSA